MKTLVFMACLLTMSYAADPQILKSFYENYQNCLNEFNVSEWTPEVVKCIFIKYEVIDEHSVIMKDRLFTTYAKLISDNLMLLSAIEIFSICFDLENNGPGSNEEKLMRIITCSMSIQDLFDKPQ